MLKAEALLNALSNIMPGKSITWPVYAGDDVSDAKIVENYVTGFFKTGSLMPIPVLNLGLDIHSVKTEYNDYFHTYLIVIEGVVIKLEGDK